MQWPNACTKATDAFGLRMKGWGIAASASGKYYIYIIAYTTAAA